MLSLFPSLLSFNQISPFLIRLVLASIFIYWSYKILFGSKAGTKEKVTAVIEGLSGILLVIGLWTQLAAIVIAIDLVVRLIGKIMKKSFLTEGVNYYLILLVLAISLVVCGAGWFAFDLAI